MIENQKDLRAALQAEGISMTDLGDNQIGISTKASDQSGWMKVEDLPPEILDQMAYEEIGYASDLKLSLEIPESVLNSKMEAAAQAPVVFPMEIGSIDQFRIIESDIPDPQQGGTPGDYDPNHRRERMGNNRKKVSRALKQKRLAIAKASKRRNRR